ncbi:MAG: fasciclin domain-containing protein [SAR116 cluster bacterium]|nr:Nex18 symbiotically induced protein [Paracoccaceae bacterium]RCL78690.1 MAG: fasciclin domain-containing protein [SAR116 cluster bacterium]|tara:strand:- start:3384 stop:3869 length:486 start_codon:yes stop_codon:yes gene_type:complete
MIKRFLTILGFTAAIAGTAFAMSHGGKKDIVGIAAADKNFSTLVAAVQAADLVATLKSDGPFTVFAPTNEAFAALPEGTVETLLKPENKDQLAAILTYHVVAGKVMSSDLSEGLQAETVNGQKITITLGGGAKVNGANIVKADIEASNGVIHVIDAVILPK